MKDTFPTTNLQVSLEEILESQEQRPEGTDQPATAKIAMPSDGLQEVPVDLIDEPLFQPRTSLTDEEQELNTTAIALAGRVNRPLLLRAKANGRYELIGGSTRLRSVKTLKWPTVPARIVVVDDAEAEILAVTDNEGQTGLSDFEKGRAFHRILNTGKIRSVRALAERTGISPASVTRCMGFLKLPPDCIAYLEQNPRLLGGKLVADFVELGEKHPKETLEALVKIDQEGISQESALRWLKSQVRGTGTQPSVLMSNVEIGNHGEATIVRRKDSLNLKLPKGVDIELVEKAIKEALQRVT
ncbi:ParB/RepB/Spo0J family partition protein [Pseudomonas aeruginosa]|nr:ParB/RepB/Spo0J family partition protein [Pseudomonas aeruginosa]